MNISVEMTLDLINSLDTVCCGKPDDFYIHVNSSSGGNTIIKTLSRLHIERKQNEVQKMKKGYSTSLATDQVGMTDSRPD